MRPKQRYKVVLNDYALLEIVGTSDPVGRGVFYTFSLAKRAAVLHALISRISCEQIRKQHIAFIRNLQLKHIDFEL